MKTLKRGLLCENVGEGKSKLVWESEMWLITKNDKRRKKYPKGKRGYHTRKKRL